jgi:hypothetical protein
MNAGAAHGQACGKTAMSPGVCRDTGKTEIAAILAVDREISQDGCRKSRHEGVQRNNSFGNGQRIKPAAVPTTSSSLGVMFASPSRSGSIDP